jgi:hypothetical protein
VPNECPTGRIVADVADEGDELFAAAIAASLEPPEPGERECMEVLICPKCGSVDLDFTFVDRGLLRSECCGTLTRVTALKAHIGPPGEPRDVVEHYGVAVRAG